MPADTLTPEGAVVTLDDEEDDALHVVGKRTWEQAAPRWHPGLKQHYCHVRPEGKPSARTFRVRATEITIIDTPEN